MWPIRIHMLPPLTRMPSNKSKFKWTQVEQDSFDKINRIMSPDNLSTYPDFNEIFKIHTNAIAFQLGAVIGQKGKPIAFCSRKLTGDQKGYTLTEIELISIVETLKYFRTILLSQKSQIYINHKNLICKSFNTDRVLRCRLILE